MAGVRIEDAQTVSIAGAKGIGWKGRFTQTLPLRRPILLGFGLACGIFFASMVMVMMFLSTDETPRGLWVHLLRPGPLPEKTDSWTEPIVVRIEDEGPGREPIVYVGSTPTTWDELSGRLKEELSRRREWVVYVSGDDDLPWVNVTQVIDAARGLHAKVVLMTADTGQSLTSRKGHRTQIPPKY